MKLSEILEEIAEKYPHSLSNASVIRKINLIQNELFRTVVDVTTTRIYNLSAGVFVYSLPFPFSALKDVVVNGVELPFQDTKEEAVGSSFYYFIDNNGLGIYPTPKEDSVEGLALSFKKSATALSDADLTVVPDFDPDFHMILVYGALAQIAENYADIAMVNNFTAKYNAMVEEYKKVADPRPDYPVIEDTMGRWLY
ncbi:phage adaptor protein [Paenibacillus kandeliae]|uniref:phage adaptor protein n=1 Tax=Paenibacillus kandeliae TaxID=3231269 RepID=UPI003459D363